MPTRRDLFRVSALTALSLVARTSASQAPLTGAMDEARYRAVRRPPKGGGPSMSAAERDALEHRLHCQCGCRLDVYTCRTTDFTCPLSPAIHRDVMSLVEGGYSAQEILDAFVGTYGERVLMAPPKAGFNWVGWLTPFAALAAGATFLVVLLRRWRTTQRMRAASADPEMVQPTADELARLEHEVRSDA